MARPFRPILRKLVRDYEVRRTQSTPRTFFRAAEQHFESARLLLEVPGSSALVCVYLAGYAAECSLKALVLKSTPSKKWPAVLDDLTHGAHAHNIDHLRSMIEVKGMKIPPEVREALSKIAGQWSTHFRYLTDLVEAPEAREFLTHVETVCGWVERSLP